MVDQLLPLQLGQRIRLTITSPQPLLLDESGHRPPDSAFEGAITGLDEYGFFELQCVNGLILNGYAFDTSVQIDPLP